jgi:hypothetical protein
VSGVEAAKIGIKPYIFTTGKKKKYLQLGNFATI